MSTWEYNEVRQAIENTLRIHVTDGEAHTIAGLVMGVFQGFRASHDLVETTTLGSAEETAIKQRYIDARLYYGGVEHLSRPRPKPDDGWKPVLLDVSRDPQQHPRDETGRYEAECREMPTRQCANGPCGDGPCVRFKDVGGAAA